MTNQDTTKGYDIPPVGLMPINVMPPQKGSPYSGFIIVRLPERFALSAHQNLVDTANEFKLLEVSQLLSRHKLTKATRAFSSQTLIALLKQRQTTDSNRRTRIDKLVSYYRIDVRDRNENESRDILYALRKLKENANRELEEAYFEFETSEPASVQPINDPFAIKQGYLGESGINVRWVWENVTFSDDPQYTAGAGVSFIDLERSWFLAHEDLIGKNPAIIFGDDGDGIATDCTGHHGTAVLGIAVGIDNNLGIVGIAPGVTSVRCVSHFDKNRPGRHVAEAVTAAWLAGCDVLLLEIQRNGYPSEVDRLDAAAITLAIDSGVIVIEAAGNGTRNLDEFQDQETKKFILKRNSSDFLDTGATIVGASEAASPHHRWWMPSVDTGSSFGSRVDCYAWGQGAVSSGYGDLDPGSSKMAAYTNRFGGTSSAAAIVAGCALVLQSIYQKRNGGLKLSPRQMRWLFSNPATGTEQGSRNRSTEPIGHMPNLRLIIEHTLNSVPLV